MTKAQKIISIIATALASGMVILSGIMKLIQNPEVIDGLTKMGVGPYLPILGCMEIGFAILFIFPKTMKMGFILLTCYFAGAMGTDLSHDHSLNASIMTMVFIWIAAFLRDKYIFLPAKTEVVKA